MTAPKITAYLLTPRGTCTDEFIACDACGDTFYDFNARTKPATTTEHDPDEQAQHLDYEPITAKHMIEGQRCDICYAAGEITLWLNNSWYSTLDHPRSTETGD